MGPTPKWDPASPRRPRSQHDARRDAFYTLMKSEAQWKKNRSSAGQDDKKENGSLRSASDVVVDRDNANTDEYGSDNEQDEDQSDRKMSQGQSDHVNKRKMIRSLKERLSGAINETTSSQKIHDELE